MAAVRVDRLRIPHADGFVDHSNAYLVRAGAEALLIDTGGPGQDAWRVLHDGLAALGVRPAGIRQVIVTHAHRDHCGQAARLQREGAQAGSTTLEAALHRHRTAAPATYGAQLDLWFSENGVPAEEATEWATALARPSRSPDFQPDLLLQDGHRIDLGGQHLRVVWTPGHTPGHLCIVDETTGNWFAGDHLLLSVVPNIKVVPEYAANPMVPYLASLSDLAQQPGILAFPGHGEAFVIADRARELLNYHSAQLERVAALLDRGPGDPYAISRGLWGRERWHGFNHALRRNAVGLAAAYVGVVRS